MLPEAFHTLCVAHSNELFCLHTLTGTYAQVSASSYALLGYPPATLIGKNPYDFFHPDDRDLVEQTGHRPALAGEKPRPIEYRFRRSDGEYRWLRSETTRVERADGPAEFLLSRSIDVTDLVNLQADHRMNQRLFDEVGRLARIGTWEVDIATMTTHWSPMTYTIHEVDQPEVFDVAHAIDFYPGEGREIILRCVQDAIEKARPFDVTLPFVTAKGNPRWVQAAGSVEISFGKTVRLYGIFQDVTPRMEYQQRLEQMIAELTAQKQQLQEFNRIMSHNVRSPLANQLMLLDLVETSTDEAEKTDLLGNLRGVTTSLLDLSDHLVRIIEANSLLRVELEPVRVSDVLPHVLTLLDGEIKRTGAQVHPDLGAWDECHYVRIYLESILLNLLGNALRYACPDRPPRIRVQTGWEGTHRTLVVQDNGRGIDLERYGGKIFKLGQTFHREVMGKGVGLFMTKTQVESLGGRISVDGVVGEGSTFTVQFTS